MKLLPTQLVDRGDATTRRPRRTHGTAEDHGHEAGGGIEWEDDMVEVNRMTTPANMRWKLVDRTSRAENQRSTGGSRSVTR